MLRRFPLFCVIAWFCEASSNSICVKCLLFSTFVERGVAVLRGNDCRKTEILFDKACFESELKRSWRLFLVFTSFPPGMRKKANIWNNLSLPHPQKGLIKHYLCLSADISPQNNHLFPRKLRPTNISPKWCYLKPHKIMQLHKTKETFSTSR